jgi:hypothetical protein
LLGAAVAVRLATASGGEDAAHPPLPVGPAGRTGGQG